MAGRALNKTKLSCQSRPKDHFVEVMPLVVEGNPLGNAFIGHRKFIPAYAKGSKGIPSAKHGGQSYLWL